MNCFEREASERNNEPKKKHKIVLIFVNVIQITFNYGLIVNGTTHNSVWHHCIEDSYIKVNFIYKVSLIDTSPPMPDIIFNNTLN